MGEEKKKIPKWVEEFRDFAEEFKDESDRAAVILGAAQLDNYLRQLLEGYLLPAPSGSDELLDGDSPLATFSSRINCAHRLGLINGEFAKLLHLVRKIRNSFAHDASGVSLATGPHRDRIRELIKPFRGNWAFDFLIESEFGGEDNGATEFRAAIGLMSIRLQGACMKVRPLQMEKAWSPFPPPKEPAQKGARTDGPTSGEPTA